MNEASRALHELHRDPDFVSIAELRRDAAIGFLIEKAAEREIGLEMGKEIGREEGLQRGLVGQRKLMVDFLELRFGALSDAQRTAVLTADAATLERWITIVSTAASLADVVSVP